MKFRKLCLLVGCLMLTGCGAVSTEEESTEIEAVSEDTEETTNEESKSTVAAISEYNFSEYVTLGEYKDLVIPVAVAEVTADDVDSVLEQTIQSYAEYKELDVSAPQDDDWVLLKVEFDDYNWEEYVQMSDPELPEEIKMCVKSTVAGEVVMTDLNDASYFGVDGTDVDCEITVEGIYEKTVPEVTDEWISTISEFATLDAWKMETAANLAAEQEDAREYEYKSTLYDLIMSNAEFKELPEELVDSMHSQFYEEDVEAAENAGVSLEELVTEYYGFTDLDEYELSLNQFIEECIKDQFLTAALADELDISYTNEEYNDFVEECLTYYGYETAEELEDEYGKETIEQACLNDVVWDAVMDLNTMTE